MLHVLLIEDNAADVMVFREALRSSPIAADVMIAYDGEQALRMLEELGFRPDLIVLDLNIPKFDGHAILSRQEHAADGAPVVVFTSSTNPDDKRRAMEHGAKDYVIKPVGFQPFIRAVQELINRWGTGAASTTSATS